MARRKTSSRTISSIGLRAGALSYGAYWRFAGLTAPELGSTPAAVESLAWLAIPSSAPCAAGLADAVICAIRILSLPSPKTRPKEEDLC